MSAYFQKGLLTQCVGKKFTNNLLTLNVGHRADKKLVPFGNALQPVLSVYIFGNKGKGQGMFCTHKKVEGKNAQ